MEILTIIIEVDFQDDGIEKPLLRDSVAEKDI